MSAQDEATSSLVVIPVNEFLAVEVSHGTAELITVQHEFDVAKSMMIAMQKLSQLHDHTRAHAHRSRNNHLVLNTYYAVVLQAA